MIVIAVLFFIVLSSNPLIGFIRFLWQYLFNTKPINLKQQFGNWAVVTGSTDGIGKEYAKELAKRDINIILISRSIEKLRTTKNEISSLNSNIKIKIIQADFSEGKDSIEKIANEVKDIPIGILVNNVGTFSECPMYFGEYSRTDLWKMINVNIGAMTLMTHMFIEQMKKRRKGAIVNVSSGTEATPLPLMSFYAASKTLVRYFSDAIRAEHSQFGLTVQTLSPYYVTTKMVKYNPVVQGHQVMFPDAATYARNAITTLGKLDSTAGYWVHDLFHFLALIVPMWIRTKFAFIITSLERKNYFNSHKENID
ncbi:hydroxysteroid dehydrogenase-like protein 1 [Phymastichus coffea]|uniref:hydroxysteroid dehydrogenase-like protein 1 n=1 Tax=Phymastichus coffea TaxID=108790 RepID=UPI00273C68DC|nr:hydroxysteroid dehydrogenase-like protein 1 [Phymastichus coffea]